MTEQVRISVTSNRRHEAWLNLPILDMRVLLKNILGSLTTKVISEVSSNPLEAFRSHVCGTGYMRPEGYPICPLYSSGVCKGPDNNGKAKIVLADFKFDEAHCVDGLNKNQLGVCQESAQQENNRRAANK